ncbi:MAG: OadG family protein [Bacteroidales bacterium]|nr:OadG family protein [Bacteroidales bacterium]
MKRKYLILLLAILGCATVATAQNRKALRINEVMVDNESSIVDEYGNRSGWIELFNANYGPLEIASVFLTTDSLNPTMYPVPMGDELTKIGKRQHVLFHADGEPNKGTFHTNFVLVPGKDNWVGLYDADGRSLIDYVIVPASLLPDQSYARVDDGFGEWEVRNGSASKYITPSSANIIKDKNNKIELFARVDGHGFGMAAMAMCIVFSALLVLCLAFMLISKIGAAQTRKNKARAHGVETKAERREVEHDSGEEIAAICMALYEHLNAHDQEDTVLTINKVKRAYSPWSSKIYGLRQLPH